MDSQYIVLSELLSDQAAFITSPKTSLANYWGGFAPPAPPQCLWACPVVNIEHLEITYDYELNFLLTVKMFSGLKSALLP